MSFLRLGPRPMIRGSWKACGPSFGNRRAASDASPSSSTSTSNATPPNPRQGARSAPKKSMWKTTLIAVGFGAFWFAFGVHFVVTRKTDPDQPLPQNVTRRGNFANSGTKDVGPAVDSSWYQKRKAIKDKKENELAAKEHDNAKEH